MSRPFPDAQSWSSSAAGLDARHTAAYPRLHMKTPRRFLLLLTWICLLAPAVGPTVRAQCWEAWYTTPGYGLDVGRRVVVDDSGNVYVAGRSRVESTRVDIVTVKYDANGNELWVNRYDHEQRDDAPWAITLDRFGNVYVTGESQVYIPSIDASDYVTIKYRPDGTQAWVARYGERERNDEASAIAVDSSCNVYVTGRSRGNSISDDYATVKYDSSGNELWAVRSDSGRHAYSIAVDERGGVFVTGYAKWGTLGWGTIKYDSQGNEVWATYVPARGKAAEVALDGAGNVYVFGGASGNLSDFRTARYDSLGREVWHVVYDGPGRADDNPRAMVMDDSANIYVTGCSRGASSGWDFCTIKYDSAGNELWVARLDTSPGGDLPEAMATDGKSVYVVGRSGQRFCTARYDAATGSLYWVAIYDNIPDQSGNANGVTVDEHDYTYVTGSVDRPDTYVDYLTIKFSPGGVAIAEPKPPVAHKPAPATIVRGVLHIPQPADRQPPAAIALYNLAGSKVADLRPGENDIRHLAPGVYFVRDRTTARTTKIVTQH